MFEEQFAELLKLEWEN